MRISASIITAGEWTALKRCVASLADKVDEIVVTCEPHRIKKARQHVGLPMVKFVGYHWSDDFAEARNTGLRACTGDWVLSIDSDEAVDGDLRSLCEQIPDHVNCAYVSIMSFATEGTIGVKNEAFRLFRNHIGFRFEGRIHEQLVNPDQPPVFATQEGVTIFHWGYLPEFTATKHVRNLRILQKVLNDDPSNIYANFNLGQQHIQHEDFHQALAPFQTAIRLWEANPEPRAFVPAMFSCAIYSAFRTGELELAVAIAARAPKEAFTPDYFYYTALAAAELGLKDDAKDLLIRGQQAVPDRHFHEPSVPTRIAVALEKMG